MNIVKFVLVFFVLCICLTQFKPLIETFYQQVQGLPFNKTEEKRKTESSQENGSNRRTSVKARAQNNRYPQLNTCRGTRTIWLRDRVYPASRLNLLNLKIHPATHGSGRPIQKGKAQIVFLYIQTISKDGQIDHMLPLFEIVSAESIAIQKRLDNPFSSEL